MKVATIFLQLAIFLAGVSALSWEIIWQHHLSLALGVSAWGTALTLAVMMGGMGLGSWLVSAKIPKFEKLLAEKCYALCEIIIAISGLLLPFLLKLAEELDVVSFQSFPKFAALIYLFTLVLAIGPSSLAMGASLPFIAQLAANYKIPLSLLYGFNTLGAASGTLILAFVLIPNFGIQHSSYIIVGINSLVAIILLSLPSSGYFRPQICAENITIKVNALRIAFITGFASMALEVAWFRALRAAFRSTTETFAVLLAAVLISLGIGARLAKHIQIRNLSIGHVLSLAAILVLLCTPMIERMDLVADLALEPIQFTWLMLTLCAIGPGLLAIGICLPWILDQQASTENCAKIYALNTFGGVLGSLLAAWFFLPQFGFSNTSILMGVLLLICAFAENWSFKIPVLCSAIVAAYLSISFSGLQGKQKIVGHLGSSNYKIVDYREAPESSVAVVEFPSSERALIIDGFHAATEIGLGHYMKWMGHLPMLLQANPKNALVICLGTGQTANAVRQEGLEKLTIVDINSAVFDLNHYFSKNQQLLQDARVEKIVMDGRAFLRRSQQMFDVITLEPMPPNFAGVNALYSREFYELAAQRLAPQGAVAQWVTFRLVSPKLNASIVRTFLEVFPESFLWVDPVSQTGIIVGGKLGSGVLSQPFPGFQRQNVVRDLTQAQVEAAIALQGQDLVQYSKHGQVVTDDNQKLAYGPEIHEALRNETILEDNLDLVHSAAHLFK